MKGLCIGWAARRQCNVNEKAVSVLRGIRETHDPVGKCDYNGHFLARMIALDSVYLIAPYTKKKTYKQGLKVPKKFPQEKQCVIE